MSIFPGLAARARGLFIDTKGPWGPTGGGNGGDDSGEPPSGGPWSEPPRKRRTRQAQGNITSLDEFLKRSRARLGDGGGGFSGGPSRSMITWVLVAIGLLWLVFTSFHIISPSQRGVVTTFGNYSRTLGPGVGMTLPFPVERVQKLDVENIRNIEIGSASTETLMLTGDQNIIDIAYSIRWNIRDPENYLFQLAQPDETIRDVAEAAMRAVVATVSLDQAIGEGRGDIEARVTETMQRILDAYGAGVVVQGVAIRQADPPEAVNEAFKEVTAAQQQAQSYINQANAYAIQLTEKAEGEAAAFDKVYEEYRLAPEVTRRRMYYETMERVLQNVDKTIIEAPGVTPYLPLNEMQRRQSQPRGEGQ